MPDKLRIVSFLGALAMFFVPWIEMRCNGERFLTQNGVQTIHGGASLAAELAEHQAEEPEEELAGAPMVGAALALVLVGLVASVMAVRGGRYARRITAWCAIAALTVLLAQAAVGFPLKQEVARGLAEGSDKPGAALMGMMMASNIRVGLLPGFYITLACLAVPVLVAANGMIDRMRVKGDPRLDGPPSP